MWADVIGWVGAVVLLTAFYLVSTEKVKPTNVWFQVANIVGAMAVTVNSFALHAFPSVAVNIVWSVIAGYAIVKNRKQF